ncbi:hypothetical protein HDU76_011420, partial [Blyttiomyces sp. JEL0837]
MRSILTREFGTQGYRNSNGSQQNKRSTDSDKPNNQVKKVKQGADAVASSASGQNGTKKNRGKNKDNKFSADSKSNESDYQCKFHENRRIQHNTADCRNMQALKNSSIRFEKEEYKRIMKGGSPLKYGSYSHQKEYPASSVLEIPPALASADNETAVQLKAFEYLKSIMGMTTTAQANKILQVTAGASSGNPAGGSNGQGSSASNDLRRILHGSQLGFGMRHQ